MHVIPLEPLDPKFSVDLFLKKTANLGANISENEILEVLMLDENYPFYQTCIINKKIEPPILDW